jgi:hypothetical protein
VDVLAAVDVAFVRMTLGALVLVAAPAMRLERLPAGDPSGATCS